MTKIKHEGGQKQTARVKEKGTFFSQRRDGQRSFAAATACEVSLHAATAKTFCLTLFHAAFFQERALSFSSPASFTLGTRLWTQVVADWLPWTFSRAWKREAFVTFIAPFASVAAFFFQQPSYSCHKVGLGLCRWFVTDHFQDLIRHVANILLGTVPFARFSFCRSFSSTLGSASFPELCSMVSQCLDYSFYASVKGKAS